MVTQSTLQESSPQTPATKTMVVTEEAGSPDADDGPVQCKVCKEIFDSSRSMNRHMRIHGMAFLHMKKDTDLQGSP